MAKRTATTPSPTQPTISLEEGKRRLQIMLGKGREKIVNGRVGEEIYKTWVTTTSTCIEQTFGSDSRHLQNFHGTTPTVMMSVMGEETNFEAENAQDLQRKINLIEELIETIDLEAGFSSPAKTPPAQPDFWSLLHPDIVQHSKARYEAGHFADAVEAAFKHVNTKVKDLVLRKTAKELDGAALMRTAFTPNGPVIVLDDLSTESGKSIQQGYMDIFAGSITGIRNPKAHANIQIDSKRTIHLLYLASLLLCKLDDRL